MFIHRDFLNFLRTPETFEFEGKYDTPIVKGLKLKNPDKFHPKLVEFHLANKLSQEERKKHVVHFFLDDYLFERVWNRPEENTRFLSNFRAVLSPNFSQYTNMSRSLQIYNHYRTMWMSAYWQYYGLTVIPILCWSDKESFEYCLDGMPKNSVLAVSSLGCQRFEKEFRYGYERSIDTLQPSKILFYGKPFNWIDDKNVVFIQSNCDKRFETLREKQKAKQKEEAED